jgi:hypothetical protein
MAKKPVGRGRPSAEVKKVPFTVMLDPRYLDDLKATAASETMDIQTYMRRALEAYHPNRHRVKPVPFELPKIKAPKG